MVWARTCERRALAPPPARSLPPELPFSRVPRVAAQASARLEEIEILAIDCQATAAASAGGRLLELGWCRVQPGARAEECGARSRVIAQPPGAAIPRRVRELTGIDEAALRSAVPAKAAWTELLADARP